MLEWGETNYIGNKTQRYFIWYTADLPVPYIQEVMIVWSWPWMLKISGACKSHGATVLGTQTCPYATPKILKLTRDVLQPFPSQCNLKI